MSIKLSIYFKLENARLNNERLFFISLDFLKHQQHHSIENL